MAASDPLPYFPFWANDWLLSEARAGLSLDAQGLYILLLCRQWRDHGLIDSRSSLIQSVGINPKAFDRLWADLKPLFPLDPDGRRRNPRLEEERAKIAASREIRRKGGKARAASAARMSGKFGTNGTSSPPAEPPAGAPAEPPAERPIRALFSPAEPPAGAPAGHQDPESDPDQEQDQDPATAGAAAEHLPVETVEILSRSRRKVRAQPLYQVPAGMFQAFVRSLRETHGETDEASFKDIVKTECARRGWAYDAHIISTALRREDARLERLQWEGAHA